VYTFDISMDFFFLSTKILGGININIHYNSKVWVGSLFCKIFFNVFDAHHNFYAYPWFIYLKIQ